MIISPTDAAHLLLCVQSQITLATNLTPEGYAAFRPLADEALQTVGSTAHVAQEQRHYLIVLEALAQRLQREASTT